MSESLYKCPIQKIIFQRGRLLNLATKTQKHQISPNLNN